MLAFGNSTRELKEIRVNRGGAHTLWLAAFAWLIVVSLPSTIWGQGGEIKLHLVQGRVALSRTGGGTWLELGHQPLSLRTGDMVRTDSSSLGEIRLDDGSLFRLKANSVLTLVPEGIRLQTGDVWISLTGRWQNFSVITPTAECRVLGTVFDVNADRFGHTRVRVFRGIVAVRGVEDKRRTQLVLQRGMTTTVKTSDSIDETPGRFNPATVEAQLKSDWERRLLPPTRDRRVGPELPPIRDRKVGPELPPYHDITGQPLQEMVPEMVPLDDVRSRLREFEYMRWQRIPMPSYPRSMHSRHFQRNRFKALPADSKEPELPHSAARRGHTTSFGHSGRFSPALGTTSQLREEITNHRTRAFQNREQIIAVSAELASVQSEIRNLYSGGSTPENQLLERAQNLGSRLLMLHEEERRLVQRGEDLSSRLR